MIEINLLPVQMRKKRKTGMLPGGISIPLEVVIGIGGGLFMLLILVHIILLGFNLKKIAEHKAVKGELEAIAQQKQQADAVIQKMRSIKKKYGKISEMTIGENILWSKKLNILSNRVPRGVWLKRVALQDGMFFVQGSSISRQSNEMVNVHNFTTSLKSDPVYMQQFNELDIGSIQRRNVGKLEVADFVVTTSILESKKEEEDESAE